METEDYVHKPVDKKGRPISIGDVVLLTDPLYFKRFIVRGYEYLHFENDEQVRLLDCTGESYLANECQRDMMTLGDILAEMLAEHVPGKSASADSFFVQRYENRISDWMKSCEN